MFNSLIMRFKLKRTCKCLGALLICTIVYLFVNCGFGGCAKYKLDPIHVANSHPELGEMMKIEDFWTPEKEKYTPRGPGSFGEPVETEAGSEHLKDSAYAEYGFNQYISDKISLERPLKDTRHFA